MGCEKGRVTLAMVAQEAGVSRSAVCQALRGSGRIAIATRDRIRAAAEALGYAPDARIAEVMAYLQSGKIKRLRPAIAYLHSYSSNAQLETDPYSRLLFRKSTERAETLGFRLEPMPIVDPGRNVLPVHQFLKNKGIEGVLFSGDGGDPGAWDQLEIPAGPYVSCGLTQRFASDEIDHVGPDHYQGMMLVLEELDRRGYKRIGFLTHRHLHDATGGRWDGAFTVYQATLPRRRRLPAAEIPTRFRPGRDILPYIEANMPDALVVPTAGMIRHLIRWKVDVPGSLGAAALYVDDVSAGPGVGSRSWSGINQGHATIARRAVDNIAFKLLRKSFDPPADPAATLIPARWQEGNTPTVRAAPAGTSPHRRGGG